MNTVRKIVAGVLLALAPALPGWTAELIMVEQRGCLWCARWNAEIGPIYEKTTEGAFAPIRRIDLQEPRPEDVTFSGPLRITPTFVLVVDGEERARLEGYPGEDFFWALLEKMLKENTDYTGGNG